MSLSIVNQHADTIILNVKGPLPEGLAEELDRLKTIAQEAEDIVSTRWQFQGMTLFLRPNGSGRQWRWVLFCGDHYLHLEVGKGKLNGICVKVRLSSLYLHSLNLGDIFNPIYAFLVDFLGGEAFTLQVSEVHLCVDIAGWELTYADMTRFVSRGKIHEVPDEEVQLLPETTGTRKRVRAFEFSKKAPHSVVLYDKAKEVAVHQKQWFHEVWRRNGWDGEAPVLRVECRYEREWLRDHLVEEPYAMLDQFAGMWAYSTQEWVRHVTPTQDSNQSRWETTAVWVLVQSVRFDCADGTPLVKQKKVELDAERSKAGFVGYATSWATRAVALHALRHITDEGLPVGMPLRAIAEDGSGFIGYAFDQMQAYLDQRKAQTFVEVMHGKAKLLGVALAA